MVDAGAVNALGTRLRVLFVQRKPNARQRSLERLFDDIRRGLRPVIGREVFVSPFHSRGFRPRLRNLFAVHRAQKADVYHVTGDILYAGLALPGARTVLTVPDCGVLYRTRGWRRAVLRAVWFEWPIRTAARVVALSDATRQDLLRWVSAAQHEKICVIPACVSPKFLPSKRPFDEAKPVFLQVGTQPNKNLGRVAAALNGLSCRLAIVGELTSAQKSELDGLDLEVVEHGTLDEQGLLDAYEGCDALVFASLLEGFGLPIAEAQATGKPVITSARGATLETAGAGALFVDPENVESIRTAVLTLIRDKPLRAALVARGFRNVKRFRCEPIASRYEAIYWEVAAANARKDGRAEVELVRSTNQ